MLQMTLNEFVGSAMVFLLLEYVGFFSVTDLFGFGILAVVSFFLTRFVFSFFRSNHPRRVIVFDLGGVVLKGDFFTDELTEDTQVRSLIQKLRKNHRLGLATNNNADLHQLMNKKFGFSDLFDFQVISGQIGVKKPNPRFFEAVYKKAGVAPGHIVFIDDDAENIRQARNSGFNAIQFESAAQVQKNLNI